MKIVCKYKDFYDYLVQDNNADLIYVRNIGIIDKYYDDLFERKNNYTPYYYRNYGYYLDTDRYKKLSHGSIFFNSYIFGIYPYVYSQPVLELVYIDSYYHKNILSIIIGKSVIDDIFNNGNIDGLISLGQKELNKLVERGICQMTKVNFSDYETRKNRINSLKRYVWKVECPELFNKISAPVFTKYYVDLYKDTAYYDYLYNMNNKKHYITNICFSKLNKNILKYWYDDLNNINTYNNIENFLWSIKQEPIANPDNKTKIISHGFDLKTSFRKM